VRQKSEPVNAVFYVSSAVAILATGLAITRTHAVHALLYLVSALLALAVIFYTLGAPFIAAFQVIVYAGAIMVLFVFVVMMLNEGARSVDQESKWLSWGAWVGPAVLSAVLLIELALLLTRSVLPAGAAAAAPVDPKQVGLALFGPYLLGVELASMLLLSGLVGAFHLGRREMVVRRERDAGSPYHRGNGHGHSTKPAAQPAPERETGKVRVP
jgi:NADH-quinone oxidoreductase subunit J